MLNQYTVRYYGVAMEAEINPRIFVARDKLWASLVTYDCLKFASELGNGITLAVLRIFWWDKKHQIENIEESLNIYNCKF